MSDKSVQMGQNRTGIKKSPEMSEAMQQSPKESRAEKNENRYPSLREVRQEFNKEAGPVGSVPPPDEWMGVAKAGADMVQGKMPHVLINKIGERLAFERMGVRLYEALLTKCETSENPEYYDKLQKFQQEELEHFQMLRECLEKLGADPTAVTPGADVSAVASQGLMNVMTDPRTNFSQSLEALLVAELADNDAWELLIEMTKQAGKTSFVEKFRKARENEDQHLAEIRKMVMDLNKAEESLFH